MLYPVVVYGSPLLRRTAKEIDKDYPGLEQLISDMWETMEYADGVGLAAPQIGKSIRLIVIDASPMAEDDPKLIDFKKVIINPIMLDQWGDEWAFTEGCLSLPRIREDVMRPSNIKIEYYDENFNFHQEEFDGIAARIIQHEYDHLEGKLFIDHIPVLRKKLLRGKLQAIAKGKVSVDYKTKVVL